MTAMLRIFFAVVLFLHVGYSITSSGSPNQNGSHNLFKLERSNNSVPRNVRCTPCEDTNLKRPVSNHLDPEYRGNGADNLGYDWSPMAWGGPAFPRRLNQNMRGMRGRDGKMMTGEGVGNQDSSQVICDTCRSYWYDRGNGGDSGKGGNRGRQFNMYSNQNLGSQSGHWKGSKMLENYETRVTSPTVGVLVKPGSRIAYIPSRSGEMYWDGVSGGGTRWDGFSNGISWVGGNPPQWDRSDNENSDGSVFVKPGGNFYVSNGFGAYGNQPIPPNWEGNPGGRQYYFTNGVPNDIDPQRKERGYASNWHYGFTSQNGWNDNSMKWNFGGKQWADNDRAANRFYFNTPQDRTFGPNDGVHRQYGNQYPNYQEPAGYHYNLRPQPSWPTGGSFRPNDRFPSNFQQDSFNDDDNNRPWDYNSGGSFGQRRQGPRPFGGRPGSGYSTSDKNTDSSGRGPYGNNSPSDKNFGKPWNKPSYSSSKPLGSGGNFLFNGNNRPEETIGSSTRPSYPSEGGHLFIPNDKNFQLVSTTAGSGNFRPTYSSRPTKFGTYLSSDNQIGTEGANRFPAEHGGTKRPVIYTGGTLESGNMIGPIGNGGSSGRYPSGGRPLGGYSSSGSPVGGYPSGGGSSGSYPSGARPTGDYPSGVRPTGDYPSGGSPAGGYPSGGSPAGGYPSGGSPTGGYPSGGSPAGAYPSGGSPAGGYPSGGSPTGGYPSGGSPAGGYPSGGSPAGGYPSGGNPAGGYPSGGSPAGGYPSGGSPAGGYPSGGSPVGGYPSGGGLSGYPSSGRPYPNGGSASGTYPSGSRPSEYFRPSTGYPNSNYPFGENRPGNYASVNYSPSVNKPAVYHNSGNRPDNYYSGVGYPVNPGDNSHSYPGENIRPGPYPDIYPNTGHVAGAQPAVYSGGSQPEGFSGNRRPDGYFGNNKPNYPNRGGSSQGNYQPGGKKGYYTGFITEINPDDRPIQYGGQPLNYFGGVYPGDKNFYPGKDSDKYYSGGGYPGGYSSGIRNKYPAFSEDRYSTSESGGYSDGANDKFYYGQNDRKNKYPNEGYPSNHKYPNGGLDGYDKNQGSSDKNSWNYGQSERKDGIYRRSGGSYPPYRGGQYFTSSYLASMSTTAGSTPSGTEPKTQSATKSDEVTQATSDSS